MSVLTVPAFSAHLLKTVTATQGLLTMPEYRVCPPEEDSSAQVAYLQEILGAKDAQEIALQVWNAWELLRRETALVKLTVSLQKNAHLAQVRYFLDWQRQVTGQVADASFRKMQARMAHLVRENHALASRAKVPSHSISTAYSFDSAVSAPEARRAPVACAQDPPPGVSACERLFSDAKEKEQVQAVRKRIREEQYLAGCTFRPDTASSAMSFVSLQSSQQSRTSTPSKPHQKSSEELALDQCSFSPAILHKPSASTGESAFQRLYSIEKSKRNQQRLREAEKQSSETQDCTFKPEVLRSQTPEPRRFEQLHEVLIMQNYAHILQRRRLKELNKTEMELDGLTFKPAVNGYKPVTQPVRASVEEAKNSEPVRLKPKKAPGVSKPQAKAKSMDLMTRVFDSVEAIHR